MPDLAETVAKLQDALEQAVARIDAQGDRIVALERETRVLRAHIEQQLRKQERPAEERDQVRKRLDTLERHLQEQERDHIRLLAAKG